MPKRGTSTPFSLYYGSWECPSGSYPTGTPFQMFAANMALTAESGAECVLPAIQSILACPSPAPLVFMYENAMSGPFTIQNIAADGSFITLISSGSMVATGTIINFIVFGLTALGGHSQKD